MPACPTCTNYTNDPEGGPCLYCRRHLGDPDAEVFSPLPEDTKEVGLAGIARVREQLKDTP